MPRKSIEELSIAAVSIPTRPTAPQDLNERQRQIWSDVADTKPPEWFEADSFPLLRGYCVAADLHEKLTQQINTYNDLTDPALVGLIRLQETQARIIGNLGVKMRLTQQSRYTPGAAATASKKTPSGQKPWD